MLTSLLCCLGRVPHTYEEEKGVNYTQRPARTKDADCESRTSKNSQSSIENAGLRDEDKLSKLENVTREDKERLSERQRRDFNYQALESQKVGNLGKGNKGKPHWWQKPKHAPSDVQPIQQNKDLDYEVSSLSSCFTDSQISSREINNDSFEDTRNGRSLHKQNSIVQHARKTKDMPVVLPSKFQFRRSSATLQKESMEKGSPDSSNIENVESATKSKTTKNILKFLPGQYSRNTNDPKTTPKGPAYNDANATVDQDSKPKNKQFKMRTPLSWGNNRQKTSCVEDNIKTVLSMKGDTHEQVNNTTSNHLMQDMAESRDAAALKKTKNDSRRTESDQSQRSGQESSKDTDSGITSGSTTRTTTPEQRVLTYRSISDQSSVPGISVTKIRGASFKEEDDDLDELFNNRHPNQLLGSRSSLADSRESIYSCYSDAGEVNYGRIPVTGEIMFNIAYDKKGGILKVHVKQCKDLAPVDTKHNRSDPYVKTYLLPDKTRGSKRKTRIKKHTLNPVFDEVLKYQVNSAELESRTLWLTVWHNDRLGRNDFLGEVTIPLDYYNFDQNIPTWYPLQERAVTQDPVMFYKGVLLIALKYIPADMVEVAPKKKPSSFRRKDKEKRPEPVLGEVHVLVREAQNLTAMRASAGSNPFCKGYLLPHMSHTNKQKTPVIKKTTNPQWQHILVFEGVAQTELHEYGLELTIWDHEKLSSNDFLGGVRLNLGYGTHKGKSVDWMDARGEEIEAWQAMIDHPNEWVDAQLPLRAGMGKQNVKK